MNTKNVCKELGISPKALRIYEDLGIVVPQRSENNYRNYEENNILKLRQVILLKEMGIPLKNIKSLLSREFHEDNKIIRGLDLQLKAVGNKLYELENIKTALQQSINEALAAAEDANYDPYFDKISRCLRENKKNRTKWIDKWGFDSWAKSYDNSVYDNSKDGLKLFEKYDYVLDTAAKMIEENECLKVLDIGCGTGNLYGRLKHNIQYTGLDQSIEMLIEVKGKYPAINVRLGNFLEEPFIIKEFDAIVTTYAFHHLNTVEKEKSINLLLRYLKSGGKIIIADLMFLNESERQRQKEEFFKRGRKDLWDIIEDEYYTDIERLKKYAELLGCGFKYQHLVNFTWLVEIDK